MGELLLFNLSGKEKFSKIKFAAVKLGLRIKDVSPDDFNKQIGYIAGMDGFDASAVDSAEAFNDEMLVMNGLRREQFSLLLDTLRKNHASVALKAVVTETNSAWSANRLRNELSAEAEAFKTRQAAIHK